MLLRCPSFFSPDFFLHHFNCNIPNANHIDTFGIACVELQHYNCEMAQISASSPVSTSASIHTSTVPGSIFRPDGRAADALRPIRFTPNFVATAEGSVLVETGNTRVLCTATVEESVPQFLRGSGKGWITAEYSMLPRATVTRTPREVTRGRPSGRTHEIQRLIGRSLRAVVDMDKLGERSVLIDCDVLQADGGTRTAAITGAYVAMAIAIQRLVRFGTLRASPLRDHVAATSAGIVGGTPMLDLCYEEDSQADVDMNLVTGSGRFVEVQATAEKVAFDDERLATLLRLARGGISDLIELQRRVLAAAV